LHVQSFRVPCTTLNLVRCFFRLRPPILLGPFMPLRHFLPGPFRSPPLCNAGTKQRVSHPTVAAQSCPNRPSHLVHVFRRPWHLTARRRFLDRSSGSWGVLGPLTTSR
jgi:hypothetical protein